jgi:mono/diheme cytochrome c family protein
MIRTTSKLMACLALAGSSVACGSGAQEPQHEITLAAMDSVLVELGGPQTGALDRATRWRMISSIGSGLPPADFEPADLPEPESRGAYFLQIYCVQCHGIATPQMHAAVEWPILVRRMLMRSETLKNRMGGPITEDLVGEMALEGATVTLLPSPAQVDTLISYLTQYALPIALPGEIGDEPGAETYVERCSVCHETPSPQAHTAAEWDAVVGRMQGHMVTMDLDPLTPDQMARVKAYLQAVASP